MAIKITLETLADYMVDPQDSPLCWPVLRGLGNSFLFKGVFTTRDSKRESVGMDFSEEVLSGAAHGGVPLELRGRGQK